MKVYSNAGDNLFIYCVNKQPVLFEVDKEKVLYPTGNISSTVLEFDYSKEKKFYRYIFTMCNMHKGCGALLKTSYPKNVHMKFLGNEESILMSQTAAPDSMHLSIFYVEGTSTLFLKPFCCETTEGL